MIQIKDKDGNLIAQVKPSQFPLKIAGLRKLYRIVLTSFGIRMQ